MPTYTEQREIDEGLTLDALAQIVDAQRNGDLPRDLQVSRLPTQIVLQRGSIWGNPIPQEVLDWVREHFEGEERLRHRAMKVGTRSNSRKSKVIDEYIHIATLREADSSDRAPDRDYLPRIEVWGVHRPHFCARWSGTVKADGRARWTCAEPGCHKAMPVRVAREKGLLA